MENRIYIVGAHSRGKTFFEYVTSLYPEVTVAAYLVDEPSENESIINGIPVLLMDGSSSFNKSYPVYIATRGVYHDKIRATLQKLGMEKIYSVDVELDRALRNAYVKKVYEEKGKPFMLVASGGCKKQIKKRIYVATSVFDKQLKTEYAFLREEQAIQVGTALTEQKVSGAELFDDIGENISAKNRQFCELTALYWIWKNAKEDVVGLVHYRRHFLLPINWDAWMEEHKVDVILPVPLFVAPNIEENYKGRHCSEDWDCMMSYLERSNEEDYDRAKKFFQGGLYSPCNMFIMKKTVLDELCEWLFPILNAVAEEVGEKDDAYANRYPGFLSERLITYFFESGKGRYKVAYADKNFLS